MDPTRDGVVLEERVEPRGAAALAADSTIGFVPVHPSRDLLVRSSADRQKPPCKRDVRFFPHPAAAAAVPGV